LEKTSKAVDEEEKTRPRRLNKRLLSQILMPTLGLLGLLLLVTGPWWLGLLCLILGVILFFQVAVLEPPK
jgi:hypothetical protein